MIKALLNISNFKNYAQFLLENHIDDLVRADLKRSFELDLPLLKLFEKLTEQQLFELSKKGITEYLIQITQDSVYDSIVLAMENWKADKIEIPREKVVASDIALLYNVRKHSLLTFLPNYTSETSLIITIIKEIEDFYTFQEEIAIQTFAEIKNELIDKNEKRLKEAQGLAKLGYWDYDLEKNEVRWSEELYNLYEIDPKSEINSETIARFIVAEDMEGLREKVKKITEEGGSYIHEYRIRNNKGVVKHIFDKAYLETTYSGGKIIKGISQDITENKAAENELIEREIQLNEAQAIAHLGSWEWDTTTNVVNWSNEMFRLYGFAPGEAAINYEVYMTHVVEEDRPIVSDYVNACYLYQKPYSFEHRITRKDGAIRWLLSKGKASLTEGEKTLKMSGIAMDITEQKYQEDQLKSREQQLLAAQSIAQVGSFELNLKNNQLNWTKELYNIFEISPDVPVNYDEYRKLIHPDDLIKVNQGIDNAVLKKEDFNIEYRIRTANGNEKNIWAKGKVNFNQGGIASKFIGTAADITSRKTLEKELKQSEEKFRLLAEHATDVISTHNKSLAYMYISPSSLPTLGYNPEEIIGSEYLNFVHPADVSKVKEILLESPFTKEGLTLTYRFKRKEGNFIWLECTIKIVTNTNESVDDEIHIASRDITKRKQAEEDLELKQIALKASNKELEAFSYTISHDLRSPLRAIDGFGRKLSLQYDQVLDAEGKRLLNIVRDSAQKMGVLIDSLLEFSRLNRKDIIKKRINTKELVEQVIQECEQENPEIQPTVILKNIEDAPADRGLLHQVWHNLISNAFKFSSKSEKPVIEIGSELKSNEIFYYVKDNGVGFEMEYKDKLYGVFQRLHTAEEFEGTGVGLATVQRIIHRHLGAVWAEAERNKGATFYFSLPLDIKSEI